jgi:2'-5' RNA ligase
MTDPRTLPNDRFGYSVYSVVAHASPEQVQMVAEARKTIGQERAVIPAHVTIRGTFYGMENLEEIRGLLRETAAGLQPAQVEFSPGGWTFVADDGDRHSCVMPCVMTPALLSLHETFDAAIRPRSKNAYEDNYRAHLTLCQDCTDEQIQQAKALVARLDIGTGFSFGSMELMGRVGPAFGGEWRLIESFPASAADR